MDQNTSLDGGGESASFFTNISVRLFGMINGIKDALTEDPQERRISDNYKQLESCVVRIASMSSNHIENREAISKLNVTLEGIDAAIQNGLYDEVELRLKDCVTILQLNLSIDAVKQGSHIMDQSEVNYSKISRKLDQVGDHIKSHLSNASISADSLFIYDPPMSHFHDKRSILGQGAFGFTHRMKNILDNGLYAVKVIPVLEENEVDSGDLQKEASFLQKLNHPHIVRYFTSYLSNDGERFHLVMEIVTGGTLAKKVNDENVSLEIIVKWLNQVVSALNYMHYDMHIQHRDIKPENILLTVDNNIKIIDLGMASIVKSRATKATKVGTIAYYSYEKALELPYDGRDDVWATGCVIAELMTKSRLSGVLCLYSSETVNNRRLKLISDCVAVDARYGGIIGRMLEPEQANRCSSKELCQWLLVVQNNANFTLPPVANNNYRALISLSVSETYDLMCYLGINVDRLDFEYQCINGERLSSIDNTSQVPDLISCSLPKCIQLVNVISNYKLNGVPCEVFDKSLSSLLSLANKGNVVAQYTAGLLYWSGGADTLMNRVEAFKYFLKAAEQGHGEAQGKVGECYLNGEGVNRHTLEAANYFRKAAEQEVPSGLNGIGICHQKGIGMTENKVEAFKWFLRAAEKGYAEAQSNVGYCYAEGEGVEADECEAFRFYNLAADQGHGDGLYYVGQFYELNDDEEQAFECFKKAADLKHSGALFSIAGCYQYGKGIQRNVIEAYKYYKLSSEFGNIDAMVYMGQCYSHGAQGVPVDKVESFRYFKEAADNGSKRAQLHVGKCYKYGTGVDINFEESFRYFKLAADFGDSEAAIYVGHCYLRGTGVNENFYNAFTYYEKSANNNNGDGLYNVGLCYKDGIGVLQDSYKAKEYFQKSAALDNVDAIFQLGVCYSNGIGVAANSAEAFRYYKIAADKGVSSAQCIVANCFRSGIGVASDLNLALLYCQMAANSGNVKGAHQVISYYHEFGVDDMGDAFKYYKLAADNGNMLAQFQIAMYYSQMEGNSNCQEKFNYLKMAAEQGSVDAIYCLGECYESGSGVKVNKKEALNCFLLATHLGHKLAFRKVIIKYEKANKFDRAFLYAKISANCGDTESILFLGKYYENGLGVSQDYHEAFKCCKILADQGSDHHQLLLGKYYKDGTGVSKDLFQAFKYFKLAADSRNEQSMINENAVFCVAHCYCFGIGVDMNKTEAFKYYKLASKLRSAVGMFNMAMNFKCVNSLDISKEIEDCELFISESIHNWKFSEDLSLAFYTLKVFHHNIVDSQYYSLYCSHCKSRNVVCHGRLNDFRTLASSKVKNKESFERELLSFIYFNLAANMGHRLSKSYVGLCYFKGEGVPKNMMHFEYSNERINSDLLQKLYIDENNKEFALKSVNMK